MSRTTLRDGWNEAKLPVISDRRVVLEHAQNFPSIKIECKQSLPPVKDWIENSDISENFINNLA